MPNHLARGRTRGLTRRFPGCSKHAAEALDPRQWAPRVERIRAWLRRRIGYGNLKGPYWFIGLEEGCGSLTDELLPRLQGEYVEDLASAHTRLPETYDRFFGRPVPALQSTWRRLIIAVLADKGAHAVRNYQAHQLGRAEGETLLAELFPLPSPCLKCWPYTSLQTLPGLDLLCTRERYHEKLGAARTKLLRDAIVRNQPAVVVAYGKRNWFEYERLLAPTVFSGNGWCKVVKTSALGYPLVAALVPHPGARGATDVDWVQLGKRIRAARATIGG